MALALLPVSALAVDGTGTTGSGDTGSASKKPENPTVEKKVNGADSTSTAAGETVKFTLTSNVPADLWECFDFSGDATVQFVSNSGKEIEGAKYTLTFHDTMDEKFALVEDSMTVKIGETVVNIMICIHTSHHPMRAAPSM